MTEGKDTKGDKLALGAGALGAAILLASRRAKSAPGVTNEALLDLMLAIAEAIDSARNDILSAIQSIPAAGSQGGNMRIEQVPFSSNVAPSTGVLLQDRALLTGLIKSVSIHWPPGCNALVDVVVGCRTQQFCPRQGSLALDSATPVYTFNEPVTINDTLWVRIMNRDAVFTHNITVVITIEGAL